MARIAETVDEDDGRCVTSRGGEDDRFQAGRGHSEVKGNAGSMVLGPCFRVQSFRGFQVVKGKIILKLYVMYSGSVQMQSQPTLVMEETHDLVDGGLHWRRRGIL